MGVRFDLGSTNLVAYLTTPDEGRRPHVRNREVDAFLNSLVEDDPYQLRPRLMSSDPRWLARVTNIVRETLARFRADIPYGSFDDYADPDVLDTILAPIRDVLAHYQIYVLPIGTWRDTDVLERFAIQAARLPGHGILVLVPDSYDGDANARVLTPFEGLETAVKNRESWPGVIFVLRSGESQFYPLDEAGSKLAELVSALDMDSIEARATAARDIISRPSRAIARSERIRVLQLSDLHFGTSRAETSQVFLTAELTRRFASVDHIVITGDLFDQPRKRHAQQYRNFENTLRLLSDKRPIVIPGNHDLRVFGNSLWRIGRSLREAADIEYQPVVVDHDLRVVFLCFDSARKGNLARGEVNGEQLLRMATRFDVENQQGRLDDYMRIALVHHHPYPYREAEVPIFDPRSWTDREAFLQLDGAEDFLGWCAGRRVAVILHGHKHVPRLIDAWVPSGSHAAGRQITTVGCGSSLGANMSYLSYNVIEWRAATQSWSVDFQVDRGDGQGFHTAVVEHVFSGGVPTTS